MGVLIIIDDEQDLAREIGSVLEDEGYSVEVFGSSEEALGYLRHNGAQVRGILLDLIMPDMDGREFRRRQLADPMLARIPTIIVSGAADITRVARETQADGILQKPVSLIDLITLVRQLPQTSGGWPRVV